MVYHVSRHFSGL